MRATLTTRARVGGLLVPLLVGWLLVPGAALAGQGWAISADVASVPSGTPTQVRLTVQNTSGNNGGGEGIGCVTVSVPSQFAVGAVSVVSVTSGWSWSVSKAGSGPVTITAQAQDDGNRLLGAPVNDILVLGVTVTGGTLGSYTWTGNEFNHWDCTNDFNRPKSIAVAISTALNRAPVVVDDAYATARNIPLVTTSGSGVLANDSDPDGDPLTASVVSGPANGTLVLASDGSFTYTPTLGFTGTDTFTYAASDGQTATIGTATIAVANTAPTAADDSGATFRNQPMAVAAPGVLANDSDGDGDPLSAVVATYPGHGTLDLAADGSYDYAPDPGWTGTDTFTYTATDGAASSAPATVTITVTDRPPTAPDLSETVRHDTLLNVAASGGVLAGATDADGDALSATLATPPTNGTATVDPNGAFRYQPSSGWTGSDSFTATVSDGIMSTTVTVPIAVTNAPPAAADDTASAWRNGSVSAPAPGVLANDADPDGDVLTASLLSPTSNGAVTVHADGSFDYTPNAAWVGTDTFTYAASDGIATSGPATVTITVSDRPPSASNTAASVESGGILDAAAPGVLASASDPDGDPLTAGLGAPPVHGTATVNPDGSYTYVPAPGYVGVDAFGFVVIDGYGGTATATVTVTVTVTAALPTPAPPTPSDTPAGSPVPTASVTPVGSASPAVGASPSPPAADPSPSPSDASSPPPDVPPIDPGVSSSATPGPSAGPLLAAFVIPSVTGGGGTGPGGSVGILDLQLSAALLAGLGVFTWSVPGLALSVPGLIVLLTILGQAGGGAVWLPLVRRKIGSFGVRRHPSMDGGGRSTRPR